MEILNLDKFCPDDKVIKFKGRDLVIPGELPMSMMFRTMKDSKDMEENPNDPVAVEKAFRTLYEIIAIRNKDFDYQTFQDNVTINQYSKLVAYIFGASVEAVEQMAEKKIIQTNGAEQLDAKLT